MKKNIFGALFLLLFFAMLLSGVATMPFIKQDGTAEKRILAEFPELVSAEGKVNLIEFPAGFEDWLDDHIGLRMYWMQQYAKLHAALGSSVNDQVIVGDNGWLYFDPTVPDYTGVDCLTENERWRVKYVLEAIDRTIDAPFVVFFAPNKSTVYPENMPGIYPESHEDHTMEWLINSADLNIIDSVSALSGDGLYHITDTHWNNKGARIGAGTIINAINSLTGAEGMAPDPYSPYVYEDYVGDLGQMLFPNDPPADSQLVYADSVQNFKYKGRYRTPEDLTITTEGDGAALNVLMLRDSFTNLLIEPISNAYSNVQYRRAMPLPLSDVGEYDVVVLEMVERRIGELLVGTPDMLARECEAWEETMANCAAEAYFVQEKDRVLIYGALDKSVDKLTDLRVAITANDITTYYEALPVSGTDT
ncbi:MAG: hypothetical protein IJC56_00905, partial [Clostridia bacterium]|nr:hypothetical protein [Clostridia bacterium]